VNAQQMAINYPDNFEVPDMEALSKIKIGDSVKVCVNGAERLWVEVTEIQDGDLLKGKIDNCPIIIDDISFGDLLSFKKENIYNIFN